METGGARGLEQTGRKNSQVVRLIAPGLWSQDIYY